MSTNHNGFEERLLGELKQVVAERAAPDRAPAARTRFGWRPRLALVAAAVALGVTGAVVAAVAPGERTSPAYAVTTQPDGKVRVEIKRLTDPDGLERELEAAGIAAEIDYLPIGKKCKEPRYTRSPRHRWRYPEGGGSPAFVIDPADFRGETLVIVTMGASPRPSEAVMMLFSVAIGKVKPCEAVDNRPPSRAPEPSTGPDPSPTSPYSPTPIPS